MSKKGNVSKTSEKLAAKSVSLNTKTIDTHPRLQQKLTYGQRASDIIAKFGGSWTFIILFGVFLIGWMIINAYLLLRNPFDPYPFILLNLVLSCLAALQAPIILMAQNRQGEWDRIDAKYDHAINRKAEREIQAIQRDLASIRKMVRNLHFTQLEKIEKKAESLVRRIDRKTRKR